MNMSGCRGLRIFSLALAVLALALFAFPRVTQAADRAGIDPAPPGPAWGGNVCVIVVGDGDDLFRIAMRQSVPMYTMMMMNGLYSPGWVYRGMTLRVPCAASYGYGAPGYGSASGYGMRPGYGSTYGYGMSSGGYGMSSGGYGSSYGGYSYSNICAYHFVVFGENLFRIGLRYGVSWVNIAAANHLFSPNLIFAGSRLAIPCASRAAPYANPYGSGGNPYTNPNPYGQPPAPNPAPGPGQGMNVTIQDFMFAPATITVHTGQTVTWRNAGPSPHTTTSDTGVWNSGTLNVGATFSQTFNTAGTFAYHCMIHPTMHGTVVVTP